MSHRTDLTDMLKSEGFWRKSIGKKHEKWTNGTHDITVPCSPSDHRAVDNARAYVRRLKRREA